MSIGKNIKTLRTMKNIKQKDMADALGYSCQNVSKWENDISTPDIDTVLSMAKFFGVTTDTLLGHLPERVHESIDVKINSSADLVVWTDFEHIGSISPEAHKIKGRHRAVSKMATRASDLPDHIMIGVDNEGKICFIREVINNKWHHIRWCWCYQRSSENECIIRTEDKDDKWYRSGKFELVLPKGGFMLVANLKLHKTRKLLEFIVPSKYHECLDPTNMTYMNFVSTSDGRYLFDHIIYRGELDNIDVTLDGESVCFSKTSDFLNPLYDNIDNITELVKQRVDAQLKEIKNAYAALLSRIEDIECMAEEAQCSSEEAQGVSDDLEIQIRMLRKEIESLKGNKPDTE